MEFILQVFHDTIMGSRLVLVRDYGREENKQASNYTTRTMDPYPRRHDLPYKAA